MTKGQTTGGGIGIAHGHEMDPNLEYRQHGFDMTGAVLPTEERGIYFDAIIEEMVDEVGDIPKSDRKKKSRRKKD